MMATLGSDLNTSRSSMSHPSGLISLELVESSQTSGSVQLVDCSQRSYTPHLDLVELAKEIQKADEFTKSIACNKLSIIAEQVRFLQEQARRVLEDAKRGADLHHVACNFRKVPSKIYYLYLRPNGKKYFSLLSPEEWGNSCPHNFVGAYRLENDLTWTPEEEIPQKNKEMSAIEEVMHSTDLKQKEALTGEDVNMSMNVCQDDVE